MCTSFAAYYNKPLYGMNLDSWPTDIKISIVEEDNMKVLYMFLQLGGETLEFAGMNSKGLFGNFQGNLSDRHLNIEPGPNQINIAELYRKALKTAGTVRDIKNIIGARTVTYPPVPPDYFKLHNLFADKCGGAMVVETNNRQNDITEINEKFMVMTNFPVSDFKDVDFMQVSGVGDERYRIAYEYLLRNNEAFDVNDGFDILKRTVQLVPSWETICSMVFDPENLAVYLAVKRDFKKVWRIDLEKKSIETHSGFKRNHKLSLKDSEILITELVECD